MKNALLLTIILTSSFSFGGWIQKADFGGLPRHRTPILAIGNKIYTGLGHYNGGGTNILFGDWWEYNTATNAWTQKADYLGGPCYHASGFTIGDYGYIGTGRITASGNNLTKDFFRYDPATNTWIQRADFLGPSRRGAVGFAINGYGYLGTGEPPSGSLYNTFYRYNPANDTWTQVSSIPTPGRVSAVGFELNGYGYVGTGGFGSWGNSQKDFWRYDPSSDSWTPMADVGSISRMESSGFALNGKGYILTGDNMSSGTNYKDMYEYDPTANAWTQLEDFPGTARRYMASTVLDGNAYCGLGTNGTNFADFWMFNPILSLLEENIESISITPYPNPATNYINVRLEGVQHDHLKELTLEVVDLMGNAVRTVDLGDQLTMIDISTLAKGNYLLLLKFDEKILKTENLVVAK